MKKIIIKLFSIALVISYPSYMFVKGGINKNIYEMLLGIFALLLTIIMHQILNEEKK